MPARENIEVAKRDLRRELRRRRAGMPAGERAVADAAIARRLFGTPEWRDARTVLCYLSFGSEVGTREIVGRALEEGRTLALPRCVEGTRLMEWFAVGSLEGLVRSEHGVLEPVRDPACKVEPARGPRGSVCDQLAIVPGLAFDRQGFRLGYGGGFYDTFLSGFAGIAAGLCREALAVDDLAAAGVLDAHDQACDLVLTDARTLRP